MNVGVAELLIIGIVMVVIFGRRRGGSAAPDLSGAVRDLQDEVAALRGQLDQQRIQMEEMAERLDFSERVVAQLREGRASSLPPAPAPEPPQN